MKLCIKKIIEYFCEIIVRLFSLSKPTNFLLDQIIYNAVNRNVKIKHRDYILSFQTPNQLCLWRSFTFSSKEPETLEWIDKFEQNSIFFDIGSNIGLYSIYAALRGHKTYSFEPSFLNLETLSKNINLNKLQNKIIIFPIALNDVTKVSELNMSNIQWGAAHSTFDKKTGWDGKNMNINLYYKTLGFRLDDLFDLYSLEFPNYVKIDVDGIEHLILDGGKKTIINAKSLLVEVSKNFHEQNTKVNNILKSLGFQLTQEINFEKNSFNQIWKKK